MTTKKNTRRGEAPVAGRHPKPPTTRFDPLSPSVCEDSISLNGLGSSRPNSSLTTEEIASKGIRSQPCHVATSYRSLPRVSVVGRHWGRNSGTAGSIPAPRSLEPEHKWQCGSPARSPVTVRASLGPLSRATGPRISSLAAFGSCAGVAESVDAPASEAGGSCP
jgi:hypothetical protein